MVGKAAPLYTLRADAGCGGNGGAPRSRSRSTAGGGEVKQGEAESAQMVRVIEVVG